jgi:hypothetical protein
MKPSTKEALILTALLLSPMSAYTLSLTRCINLSWIRRLVPFLRDLGYIRIVGVEKYRKNRPNNVYGLTKLGEAMARDWV